MFRTDPPPRRRAFTLLELMVVITLLAMTVGVTTIGMRAVTDEARLQSAVDRIVATYRLARCEATYSGRPRLLQIDATSIRIRKPTFREDRWSWSNPPPISLGSKIRVLKITNNAERASDLMRGPWQLTVQPGARRGLYRMVLQLGDRLRVAAVIDGSDDCVVFERVSVASR